MNYYSTEESSILGEIVKAVTRPQQQKAQKSADQTKAIFEMAVQREKTRTEAEANKYKRTKLIVTIVAIVLFLITLIVIAIILKKNKNK